MRLLEVLPITILQRPFDAKKLRGKSNFRYFTLMRDTEAVAAMDELTRQSLAQNEFLMITLMGGSTYMESGANISSLKPLAFFRSAFNCGTEDSKSVALENVLVNMTKHELSEEMRALVYGRWPVWAHEYSGLKILLCRKTAELPEYMADQQLPIMHLPDLRKPGTVIAYHRPRREEMAMA